MRGRGVDVRVNALFYRKETNYVCLGDVAIDALENILESNKNISKVYLCVDRDEAGGKTVRRYSNFIHRWSIHYNHPLQKKAIDKNIIQL